MKLLRRVAPIAVLLTSVVWPAAADATWPGKPGLIAYSGSHGFRTVRPDGTHNRPLLPEFGGTDLVAWSPNGREIAFSHDGITRGIWRMRADGSDRRVVVDSGYDEPDRHTIAIAPAWSPKGDRLLFTASSGWLNSEDPTPPRVVNWIWSVHRDGTHLTRLVRGNEAVWSRSGAHIRLIDQHYDIVEINADGTGYRVLARNSAYTTSLDLSPDGRRLVYQTGFGRATTFRTLNVRNGARTKFSLGKLGVGEVAWAPGGKRLAYPFLPSNKDRSELRTIRPNGRGVRTVLRFPKRDYVTAFAWQTR